MTDSTGKTALSWAARRGDDAALDLLLKAGADVSITDNLESSPLSLAARSGSVACITLLLAANADIHHKDKSFFSTLHYAAIRHREVNDADSGHMLKLLIRAGGDPNARDDVGCTPLVWTIRHDNSLLAALLLDSGSDINSRDDEGDTCLHQALFDGADNVTQLLLHRGADYTILLSNGDSILHLAAKNGSIRTLDILIAADLKGIDPHDQSRDGKTAIQMAQERASKPVGFVEKMHELVMNIDARNIWLAQTQRQNDHQPAASAHASIPALKVEAKGFSTLGGHFRTSFHRYMSQAILSGSFIWNAAREWIRHLHDAVHLRLQGRTFVTLFLGWVLGLITIWLVNHHYNSTTAISWNHSLTHIIYLGDGIERPGL